MKKLIASLLMIALICTFTIGCGGTNTAKKDDKGTGTGTDKKE